MKPAALAKASATFQGTSEEQLTVFPGIDRAAATAALGSGQNLEPPDVQIAAGPASVVQMVNSNLSTWSKSGTRLSLVDLNSFYAVPAGYAIHSPRVLYDPQSRHFFAIGVATNASYHSTLYLAMSQAADPGSWIFWTVYSTPQLIAEPRLGFSDDKVTISWEEAVPPPCQNQAVSACFTGQVIAIVQKSDVTVGPAGQAPQVFITGSDPTRMAIVPVQSLSPTTTQYLIYNNADPFFLVENQCATPQGDLYGNCPTLGVISVTGTPAQHNLQAFEDDPPYISTTAPPDAYQKNTTAMISTGDDRLTSAVWQYDRLWTSLTNGNACGATEPVNPVGACAQITVLPTDVPGMPVSNAGLTWGGVGDYYYSPAVSLDSNGDPYEVFTHSNANLNPGIYLTGMINNQDGGYFPGVGVTSLSDAAGPYDSKTSCGGQNLWGGAAAALDPADTTDVWVSSEYPSSSTNTCLWGTTIGRLTFSAPTVNSVTPNSGPEAGGTLVTITGSDFLAGHTWIDFGLTEITVVNVESPNRMTVLSPPARNQRIVGLRAAVPSGDGYGPFGAQFKYQRLDSRPPVPVPPSACRRGRC